MVLFIHSLLWGVLLFYLGAFIFFSLKERDIRAAVFAAIFFLLLFGFAFLLACCFAAIFTLGVDMAIVILGALFVSPLHKSPPLILGDKLTRYDERDIMFARARYEPGSVAYSDYYARFPEKKSIDDEIRSLSELLEPGGIFYEIDQAKIAASYFDMTAKLHEFCEGQPTSIRLSHDESSNTKQVKLMARSLGACDVGITLLKPHHLYTHVGRRIPEYGRLVTVDHPRAIIFAVEMDSQSMKSAPNIPVTVESSRQYLRAGIIAVTLATFIRSCGYQARAHIDGNYLAILPALAVDAGLGELGRLGYCIHPVFGARIRLGAITTDMPLLNDAPVTFGVQNFCRLCAKCAKHCPAGAISYGNEKEIRGVRKWSTHQEVCYRYWRKVGTDCGICMNVCPYSKTNTLPHRLVRQVIKRNAFSRRLAVWFDSLLYQRS